jgi:hypothetical protein
MNWDAISSIAQIVGTLTVVISLLYLAFQIRFARLAAADASRTARAIGVREIDLAMVNNPELRENWLKSSNLNPLYEEMGSQMDVSVEGALQVDTVCQCWMRLHWGQYKSITTPADLDDLEQLVSLFYAVRPMSYCWENSPYGKEAYDEQFVQYIDGAINKYNTTTVE